MALKARRIGETLAQYNRRVGKRPPTTVRRPTPTKQKPVTPTVKKPPTQKVKARVDPVKRQPIRKKPTVDPDRRQPTRRLPKGKPIASIDYFDKDGKRVIIRQDDPPTRRTPIPKRPTVDPKKNIQAFIDSYIPKGPTTPRPKRPTVDPRKKIRRPKPVDMVSPGFDPKTQNPDGSPKGQRRRRPPTTPRPKRPVPKNIQAFVEELRRKQREFIKRLPKTPRPNPITDTIRPPMPRIQPPRPQPLPFAETQPVRRPPDPLGGRDFRDLNRKERAEVIKARYQLSQKERMGNYNNARQNLINRFRNDPAKLRQELFKLNINIRQDDTVRKFRAGLVSRNALNNIGLPPREIQKVIFDRRMSVMPESPRKLDMILNFQIREMNLDLRETIKKMQARGATRQEIQRIRTAYRNQVARMRQNMARAKADLQAYRRTR